jgi:hypothetical protein
MTLLKKYHKYLINTLLTVLLVSLFISRKVNFSNFWYNERTNNYLDIVIDFKYLFIVIFSLVCFCLLYGVKRWNTLFVSIMSLLLGVASFFNSLVFHRLERVFLIVGVTLSTYAWYKYIKPLGNHLSGLILLIILSIPIFFDHFLISESSGAFVLLYLAITSYLMRKEYRYGLPLIYGFLGFLWLNVLTMLFQIFSGHSVGLSLFGEIALNLQTQKGLASEFFSGHQFVRGYGFFAHPNIAGFVGSISLLFFTFSDNLSSRLISIGKYLAAFLIGLSFSRIAWVSGLVILLYLLKDIKISQRIKFLAIALGGILCSLLFISRFRLSDVYRIGDLQKYLDAYSQTTAMQKSFGIGVGAYPFYLRNQFPNLENWQYEPVHNSILLVFIEFGWLSILVIGTLFYTLFFMKLKKS